MTENQVNIEELEKTLKEEGTAYYNLSKEYSNESFYNEEKEAYLLSRIWLEKWKDYVDYETIKRNQSFYYYQSRKLQYKCQPEMHPGKIDNSCLLVPINDFYNDGNPENPENIVVRQDVDQYKELKIVNEKIWKFFHEKYGGGPIIKKQSIEEETRYSRRRIIEVFFNKVSAFIFNFSILLFAFPLEET